MCIIDGGEAYDVYHSKEVRAKKEHRCGECGRTISGGEKYRYTSGLYDGSWSTHKFCAHCSVAASWLIENCSGYLEGGVLEDIAEHVGEYRRMDLARLAVGMRHKWKRFHIDGLMPIPKLPPPIKLTDTTPWTGSIAFSNGDGDGK